MKHLNRLEQAWRARAVGSADRRGAALWQQRALIAGARCLRFLVHAGTLATRAWIAAAWRASCAVVGGWRPNAV
jgi:hypothetical protein